MRRSIRAVVVASLVLLGLGQSPSPADASMLKTPGIGTNVCDGYTGMCTNPVFVRDVMFTADTFSPSKGGPPHPQTWSIGRLKVAEETLSSPGAVFAVGEIRVRPFATGFFSVSTIAWGRFVASSDPARPYLFQGVSLTHDPDAMRGQDFEFIGELVGTPPPGPEGGSATR